MKNRTIAWSQLSAVLLLALLPLGTELLPGRLAQVGAAAWLCPLLAGVGVVALGLLVSRRCPPGRRDWGQRVTRRWGRRTARVLAGVFLLWGLFLAAAHAERIGSRLSDSLRAAPVLLTAAVLLLAGWMAAGGLPAFARACEVFLLAAGAVLLVLGQLGSALAAQVDRPFLQMVSGLGFEGAFQRLEELVSALWVLGDVALLGLLLLCLGRLLAWLLDRPVGKGKSWLLTGAAFLLGLPAALGDHPLAGTWVPFGNLAVVGLLVLTLLGTGEEKKLEKSEKRG